MAHIVELKIAGLAGRRDVYTAKLDRHINVFFGLNGSGKTSLLRILHSAMSGDPTIVERVPFESAEVTIHSLKYRKDLVKTIHKQDIKSKSPVKRKKVAKPARRKNKYIEEGVDFVVARDAKPRELLWIYQSKLPSGCSPDTIWNHIYLPTWRLYGEDEPYRLFTGRDLGRPPEREYDWDIIFGRRLESLWSRYSNQLLSKIQTIQGTGLANILRAILAPKTVRKKVKQLDSKKAYERVAAFLTRQGSPGVLGKPEDFEKQYKSDSQLRKTVSDINTIEQKIDEAMATRNKLEELIREMFTGSKTLVFKDTDIEVKTDDEESIGLTSLSSGEKHTLDIFIQTLVADVNTLLLDEPEISLHVDWQTRLISAMRQLNPNAQLILATHSPDIMAEISDDNIFRL